VLTSVVSLTSRRGGLRSTPHSNVIVGDSVASQVLDHSDKPLAAVVDLKTESCSAPRQLALQPQRRAVVRSDSCNLDRAAPN
jgi:uncharacterized protein (UPF0218 family)